MRTARIGLLPLILWMAVTTALAAEVVATPVTSARLSAVAVAIEDSAPAEVRTLARTRVAARLATEVESIDVAIGDRVDTGDLLVQLDCTDYRNALEQARARQSELQARHKLAGVRLERMRRLRKQQAASVDQLDEAQSERATLDAQIRAQRSRMSAAQRDTDRCRVTAPFAGLVVARPAEPGAFVQPGSPLIELVATDRIELRAQLTATQAATLRGAGPIRFEADGQRHRVTLLSIVDAANRDNRTREARLGFADEPTPVPGTAGRLRWIAGPRAVPADLLVRRDGTLGVFVVTDGRARFHTLEEAVEGRPAATDLEPDTRVVIDGRYGLGDGAAVRIVE